MGHIHVGAGQRAVVRLRSAIAGGAGADPRPYLAEVRAALDDDLNAPRACAALFQLVHDGNAALDAGASGAAAAIEVLDRAMGVLDILPTSKALDPALRSWVEERIAARDKARKAKDFKEADRIRAELLAKGVEIEDTPSGTKWRLV